MKEKIFKCIPIFSVILMFFTLILHLADTFIYPGVVKKYLLFDSSLFSMVSSVLTYFYYEYYFKSNLQKYSGIVISTLAIIFIPIAAFFTFLEIFNYPNYIFSHYHIDPHSLQIFGLFLLMQFVLYKVYKQQKILLVNKYQNWIILLFSIVFSLFLLGGNLKARWSILDDHEIVGMLGSDQKILLWEIPKNIFQTEVSHWGESVRYRPSYYFLRVTESFLWGGNPQLWYEVRILFLAIFFFVLIKLITKEISLLVGFAFAIFVMTFSYWSDIWIKLGPSEIYSVLGVSIYTYSFYKIVKANSIKVSPIIAWVGICVGGLIATGSKENFVIFALPSLFLVVDYLIKKEINLKFVFPILHVLYSIFIAVGIFIAIKKTGHDVYMNEITFGNRWSLLVSGFTKTISDFKILGIFQIAIILYFWQNRKVHLRELYQHFKKTIYFLIFLFIIYLLQIIYYGGPLSPSTRYNFPGILAKQIFWLTWLSLLLYFVKVIKKKTITKVYLGIITSLSILIIINSFNKGFGNLSVSVNNNVLSTRAFTSSLDSLSKVTTIYPNLPVILRSRMLWDYEAVFSLARYITFLNIKNQIYLDYEDENIALRVGLEKYLSESLSVISKTGVSGDRLFFKPFIKNKINSECIDFNLSYTIINSGCINSEKY